MRDATKIDDYFNGAKTLFVIPLYQRKYAWKEKHCARLFADLIKIHKEHLHSHFFGCIVSTLTSETDDDLLIIDGQQRITTISLIILAALNAAEKGDIEIGDEDCEKIRENYLFAKRKRTKRQIKLCPIEEDMKAYDALFTNNEKEFVTGSGITSNYLLFYRLIKTSGLTFTELIEAIERLIVIDIRLDFKDNPQLIFESLNSCGKDLEEADKVRNYLLMSLTAKEQEEYYHSYWHKIELLTDDEPTMFIRDYLTIKTQSISNINDLYFDFKSFDEKWQEDRRTRLTDMLDYAELYHQIKEGATGAKKLDAKLQHIANIGTTVHMPFLMTFFSYARQNDLDEKEIHTVLDIVENYWARRIICNYPSNTMQKLFAYLHLDILRIYKRHKERNMELTLPYHQVLSYVLLHKQGSASFPTDKDVEECFATRKIYRIPIDYRYFLFERMENENSPEGNDEIVKKMKEGKISIEHIMPQTLTPQWKQELGENWAYIHETYLHTFANLTLTGFNSAYSNHSFSEKKEGYIDKKGNKVDGFKDSAFRLSNFLKECNKWTLEEMQIRQKRLLESFFRLWPMITSEYTPLEKEYELVDFNDDEFELTNRLIIGYRYRDEYHRVTTWKEMLIQVCKLMYNENPTTMTYLASKKYWVHDVESKDNTKIADKCYVYSSCSTNTKKSILTYLFKEMDIPSSVLEFELVPLTDKTIENNEEN